MSTDNLNNATRPRLEGKSKDELAAIAYESLAGLEFIEMNDGHRLGFHVYRYLRGELPTLADAIYEAKARSTMPAAELEKVIDQRLSAAGASSAGG